MRLALDLIPGLRLQFSGEEPPEVCEGLANGTYLKALHLGGERDERAVVAAAASYVRGFPMFDTWHPDKRGGTGVPSWSRLAAVGSLPSEFAVSGGLTPESVGACVRLVHPSAVDVRSGVERESDGRKDEGKMRAFVRAVREADAQA